MFDDPEGNAMRVLRTDYDDAPVSDAEQADRAEQDESAAQNAASRSG